MKTTAESRPSGQACSQLGQPTPTRVTYPQEPCVVTLLPQPRASGVPALRPLQGAASPWASPQDPTAEPHRGTPPQAQSREEAGSLPRLARLARRKVRATAASHPQSKHKKPGSHLSIPARPRIYQNDANRKAGPRGRIAAHRPGVWSPGSPSPGFTAQTPGLARTGEGPDGLRGHLRKSKPGGQTSGLRGCWQCNKRLPGGKDQQPVFSGAPWPVITFTTTRHPPDLRPGVPAT